MGNEELKTILHKLIYNTTVYQYNCLNIALKYPVSELVYSHGVSMQSEEILEVVPVY